MNRKFLLGAIGVSLLILMGDGCLDTSSTTSQAEQQAVEDTHARQVATVPIPQLTNSLERINISKRLTTFDDPNKVSYIYLINYGRVMAFYTIKGKITSGNKRLTSTQQKLGDCGNYSGSNCTTTEAPELDGSYGSSASYIFFWTTDGAYVQWSSDYMLVDQPLQLSTQPELIRTVK